VRALEHHAFGHAVVQQRGHGLQLFGDRVGLPSRPDLSVTAVFGDALDPVMGRPQLWAMSVALDCPGRHGAEAGRDDDQRAVGGPAYGSP
jgi:hypothetical protein